MSGLPDLRNEMDDPPRLTSAQVLASEPSPLPPAAEAKIAQLEKLACFTDPRLAHGAAAPRARGFPGRGHGRGAHGDGAHRGRSRPRGSHGHGGGHGNWGGDARASKPRAAIFNADATGAARCVLATLNKLNKSNFHKVSAAMRLVLEQEDLPRAASSVLHAAYSQKSRSDVFVTLVNDMWRQWAAERPRTLILEEMRSEVVSCTTGLSEHLLFPKADPAVDYGHFCDVTKAKQHALGRCLTHVALIKRVGPELLETTPQQYFAAHADALTALLSMAGVERAREGARPAGAEPPDVTASIETLFDCLGIVVTGFAETRPLLRQALCPSVVQSLPSKRCVFKARDLLSARR